EVYSFTKEELKLIQSEPFDEKEFKKEYGIKKFVANKTGIVARKALVGEPTCNIAGFVSGYTGPGAKTVLPSQALVKIDFRLVPKMDPLKQLTRLKQHLRSKGFEDIKIRMIHGEAASKTKILDPFVSQVKKAANE